jgi:hypothetical protein
MLGALEGGNDGEEVGSRDGGSLGAKDGERLSCDAANEYE